MSEPETCPLQLSFGEVERMFSACGVKTLPDGVGDLTRREMVFVIRMLEHGQMAKAAVEAGYSEASAAQIASETLRKPKVFQFYRRCTEQVANEAAQIVRTTYERYVVFHAKAMTAAQNVQNADTWLASGFHTETGGEKPKERLEYELARTRAQRDEKHYSKLARDEGALLGALLGKLRIKVEGDLKFSVVSDEDREHLRELYRQGVPVSMPQIVDGGRN